MMINPHFRRTLDAILSICAKIPSQMLIAVFFPLETEKIYDTFGGKVGLIELERERTPLFGSSLNKISREIISEQFHAGQNQGFGFS